MLIGYVECELEPSGSVPRPTGKDLFTQLDRNKDGVLSKDEFSRPALFPLFDSDGNGRVTRREGTEGMVKLKQREKELRRGQESLRGLLDRLR